MRLPKSVHDEIMRRLKKQKESFNVSKNSFIVGLLNAVLEDRKEIKFVRQDENQEEQQIDSKR
jgi:histidinol-phosphate/aromatic aminotransferase/cobyric acid decarboxylase-like protein